MAWHDDDDDYGDIDLRRPRARIPRGERPHSGLGITSCYIAAIVGVTVFALISFVTVRSMDQNNNPPNDDEPEIIVASLGILGGEFISLVGIVLGVVGICQPDRNSMYATLGAIFNAFIFVGVIAVIAIAIIMDA